MSEGVINNIKLAKWQLIGMLIAGYLYTRYFTQTYLKYHIFGLDGIQNKFPLKN